MPLIVKESSWWQTPAKVFIKVPLNNIPTDKVDVFTSEKYIKLHYDRYIFEKILLHPIDDEASIIRLANNEAEFELLKVEEVLWDQLEVQVSKREATDLKIKLLGENTEKLKLKYEEIKRRKARRLKDAVSVQMKLETREQEDVSKLKECQKWEALSGNYGATNTKQTGLENVQVPSSIRTLLENKIFRCSNYDRPPTQDGSLNTECQEAQVYRLLDKEKNTIATENGDFDCDLQKGVAMGLTDGDMDSIKNKDNATRKKTIQKQLMENITRQVREMMKAEEKQSSLPTVRSQGHIGVKFTPRVFPTPRRESTAPEEEEWLKKQATAREACGFSEADLRPEENNPDWVKARGDQMYSEGNYLGAASAYSHALRLCPKLSSLYSSRAAAHLAMNNLHKATDDASEAIKLFTPPCELNRKSRIEAHLLRGRALVRLKAPKLGLLDFEQALSLSPTSNEQLKQEFDRVRFLAELPDEETEGEIDFSSPPLVITQ